MTVAGLFTATASSVKPANLDLLPQDLVKTPSLPKPSKNTQDETMFTTEANEIDIGNGSTASSVDPEKLKRVTLDLVKPPFLPKHSQKAQGGPVLVEVTLFLEEKEMDIGNGVKVRAMTFNGTIPGPLIVVHQGDYVEVTLVNPKTNTHSHNIDFHAATGALGGGALTLVAPGQAVKLRFKAIKAGVFIYHCAPGGTMVPVHVVLGMNGAIMVLPRDGLRDDKGESVHYDKAYYIGEQDFYVPRDQFGEYKTNGTIPEMLDVMRTLTPTHVVFNGAVGALTGQNAMTAKVGETVLFIHSQANRDSRPHLIGGHGELVWVGGSFATPPISNQETWSVKGGSAVAAMYTFKQPGLYAYLNHNLIEAFLLGAAGHVQVEGEWNDDLMKQVAEPYEIE